jgi:hypothetical protein
MGAGHRHELELTNGLTAAADVDGKALVGVGLDYTLTDARPQSI